MKKGKYSAFRTLIYAVAAIMVVFVGLLTPQFGFKTTDDTSLLPQYLTNYNNATQKRVLGASDRKSPTDCPLDRPIVGWVSYSGYKVLPTQLPAGEAPSVCFASFEDAYREGFVSQ